MLFIHRSCVCCSVLATSVVSHQIKADGNIDELTAALTAYGNASRAAPGNTGCDYSIANGELIMFEVFDSPNAMHIRTCTFFLFSVSFFGGFRVRVRLLSLCFRFLRFSNIYLVFLFPDVGHCFPHFIKMLPHCEMDTLQATCDPAQHEFWNTVCNSWGAKTAGAFPAL